jgi:hypothetical protein
MYRVPLLLLISFVAGDATPDPTKPSLVTLDFKDRPIQEVAAALATRSGSAVVMQFYSETDPNPKKVTLIAAEPVPFWDAIDRFCLETKLQRALNDGSGVGRGQPNVSIYGPGPDPGPAVYSGPFRFGRFTLHANFQKRFVPDEGYGDPLPDGYRAEFEVLPEPRVLAIRTGPLAKLEAIDDQDRSLLDPKLTDPTNVSGPIYNGTLGGFQSTLRIQLATPVAGARRLKVLRGVMPVELGIQPKIPTVSIALADSKGKTFKAGDVSITIEDFSTKPSGPTKLVLVAKVEGSRGPSEKTPKTLSWARSGIIQRTLEIVDADGRIVAMGSGGTSSGDELRLNYTFNNLATPGRLTSAPKTLKVYAPEWVQWEAPFEFHDVVLP